MKAFFHNPDFLSREKIKNFKRAEKDASGRPETGSAAVDHWAFPAVFGERAKKYLNPLDRMAVF